MRSRILCVLLVLMTLGTFSGFSISYLQQETIQEQSLRIAELMEPEIPIVYDTPAERDMPTYIQSDPEWGEETYSTGNLTTHGCGLTAFAMGLEYLTGIHMTPSSLHALVGDSCLDGGQNDIGKFIDFAESNGYPVHGSDQLWYLGDSLAMLRKGGVLFGAMGGPLGDEYYGGHIVLMYSANDEGVIIMDPASEANSNKRYSYEEIYSIDWSYFYYLEEV